MRFQVPQFIDTETKIVGPFTLKQFLWIAGGAIIIFLFRYLTVSLFWWIVMSLPIAGLAFGLAFYKIDGMSLPSYLAAAFSYAIGSKKYIFKKEEETGDNFNLPDYKSDKK